MSPRIPGTFTNRPRQRMTSGLGQLHRAAKPIEIQESPGTHAAFLSDSGCSVIVGHEPARGAPAGIWLPPDELLLYHLSIAHPDRYPTWDEVADARYELIPDGVTMAMLLPPAGEYVNVHDYCLHLWQIDDRRAP